MKCVIQISKKDFEPTPSLQILASTVRTIVNLLPLIYNTGALRDIQYIESTAEKLVDIFVYMADKDETTTREIVAHFGYTATRLSATWAADGVWLRCVHMLFAV